MLSKRFLPRSLPRLLNLFKLEQVSSCIVGKRETADVLLTAQSDLAVLEKYLSLEPEHHFVLDPLSLLAVVPRDSSQKCCVHNSHGQHEIKSARAG